MTTLTIGSVTLYAMPSGLSVFYLGKNGLTDWDSVPDSKSEVRERAQADGAFGISDDWRESAVISIGGWYSGVDRADAKAAKQVLRAAMNTGKPVKITLDDIDGRFSRWVSVRKVSIPDSGASPVFTFAIDTVATDPLMYGDEIVQVTGVPVSGGGLDWPLGSSPLNPVRINLVGDPNTTAVGKWSWPAAAVSTTPTIVGGRLRMTASGTAQGYFYPTVTASANPTSSRYTISAGQRWSARCVVSNPGTSTIYVRMAAAFYNAAASSNAPTQFGSVVAVAPGAEVVVEGSGVATDGPVLTTTGMLPLLYMHSSAAFAFATAGQLMDTTFWSVEIGPTAPTVSPFEFWTGATPLVPGVDLGYAWADVVNGSVSIRTAYTGPYWDFGADGQSGRLAITNLGFAETFPTLQVTGGLSLGFVIADQTVGKTIRLDRVVPLGSTVTINQRTGRVSIDGQSDVSGSLSLREFFSIPPGQTHLIQFTPLGTVTGTPQLLVRTAPAN